ncbi:MAG: plasmid stabilization protein [Novosphingobium sp. 32-60-15]|uniref:type II toxin-antitoxin system RelE/ParE family toxin n=1 Tax=unclassified Novosphingobium TaxID=2644732 RepID=UPI000BDA6F57|nr:MULTISPECIES: type II toxin-antitoxin system RelE/ParE family toxin [unclassified Novosphingobium]OYX64374.1 MAG: plasmid stabilization protein [Novosphingobium sp. 32-60-15]
MRRVQWSDSAIDDIEDQVVYIALDNPVAARQVSKRLRETGNALGTFATGHPGRVSGTYEKSVTRLPYIIVYALTDNDTAVTILQVIHTARNWPQAGQYE